MTSKHRNALLGCSWAVVSHRHWPAATF